MFEVVDMTQVSFQESEAQIAEEVVRISRKLVERARQANEMSYLYSNVLQRRLECKPKDWTVRNGTQYGIDAVDAERKLAGDALSVPYHNGRNTIRVFLARQSHGETMIANTRTMLR